MDNKNNTNSELGLIAINDSGYPSTLDYFYVAHDRQCDGYMLLQCPLSPNYRTVDEAEKFFESCSIEGARIYRGSFVLRPGNDVKGLEREIFRTTDAGMAAA